MGKKIAFLIISVILALICFSFKIMHWPYGNIIPWIGIALVLVSISSFLFKEKR